MLKEGRIELDRGEIESIYRNQKQKQLQQEQSQISQSVGSQSFQYELVKAQIFQREFVPLCVNQYSKESSMKLYRLNKNSIDLKIVNQRIRLLYGAVNLCKESKQKEKLANIFRLDEVNSLVNQINHNLQSKQDTLFIPYFEEGQTLSKVQIWRFKHSQQTSSIPYKERSTLFKDFQLILKFIQNLAKHHQFQHFAISLHSLLLLHYSKYGTQDSQYEFKLRCSQVYDLLLQTKPTTVNQFDVIDNARKVLIKILGISQQKAERQHLDQHHFQKIQYLVSLNDIIKLTYQDFYFVKTSNSNPPKQTELSHQQQLQKIKQQILSLEDHAKIELKNFKLLDPCPKLAQTTKQNNKLLWSSIEKYILSNVTQSERSAILNPVENKQPAQITKKPQKKPSSTNVKKQTKPEPKQVSKIQQKPQQKNTTNKNQLPKQLVVEARFIASASDLKFRPQHLIKSIQNKESILYILKTKNLSSTESTHIICFINAKPQKQNFNLFGSYSPDLSRKSFIYSERTDRFYKLLDKACAVGYGPEVFFSIGKLDIIVPCFGTQTINDKEMMKCVSYFPVSYSRKGTEINDMEKIEEDDDRQPDEKANKENELGMERQFLLEDIDIYEIRLKGQ